jgi:hypothetical protein
MLAQARVLSSTGQKILDYLKGTVPFLPREQSDVDEFASREQSRRRLSRLQLRKVGAAVF